MKTLQLRYSEERQQRGNPARRVLGAIICLAWIPAYAGMTVMQNAAAQVPPDAQAQLQKALGKNASPETLGQGLAVATLLGCTEKQAGQQATQALYAKIQAATKQVQAYCKAQQPAQARALLIQTFRENHADPVVAAANDCYAKQHDAIDALAGPKAAPQIAKYVHLLHDPSSIDQEITEQNVCAKKG